MSVLKYVFIIIAAYLLGALNFGIIISNRLIGSDVREQGSGNAGATNMARSFGMKAGLLTLFFDMAKTCLAMWLGYAMLGETGLMAAGMAVFVGHCFPVFYGFKGGKGISVGAAIGIMLDWRVFLVILVAFFVVALISKKVSLGSIAAAVAITVASIAFGLSIPRIVCAAFGMTLAVIRHIPNIKRVINGTEPDFKAGKEKL